MKVAQRLYEGIELGEQGATGLITYMRTDSPRVSDDALNSVRGHIVERYGKKYLPDRAISTAPASPPRMPTRRFARPRSSAIRSRWRAISRRTNWRSTRSSYNRFVSSQMNPAVYDRTTVDIESGAAVFRATGQVMKFDGFMRVYLEGQDDAPPTTTRRRRCPR